MKSSFKEHRTTTELLVFFTDGEIWRSPITNETPGSSG